MPKAAGINYNVFGRTYNFESGDIKLEKDAIFIFETEQGVESGRVVYVDREVPAQELDGYTHSVLRKATTTDLEKIRKFKEKNQESVDACHEYVRKYKLPMKLVDVYYNFDGSRITFFFTAEERVDFRTLVKDLTRHFQKTIRLEQIGSRDVAAKIGGHGLCGRELCCKRFLKNFESITTDMARLQEMSHRGSDRISGICGRLMCCLSYEASFYAELSKKAPPIGTIVKTQHGQGPVVARNLITQSVEVQITNGDRMVLPISQVKW